MNKKTETNLIIIGTLICVFLYVAFLFEWIKPVAVYFTPVGIVVEDTTLVPVAKQGLDTIVDVKGKSSFFIGDSHTANHSYGWQKIVCESTGMKMRNYAVVGKHLPWMVQVTNKNLTKEYDFCFIYGGCNDIHGNRNPYDVVKDVQKIVDICNSRGVKPIVLTGFDAEKCVKPIKGQEFYPKAYTTYQKILIDSLRNATIIDTRVVVRTDCGDWTCHMNPSGHKKVAEQVLDIMNFKSY